MKPTIIVCLVSILSGSYAFVAHHQDEYLDGKVLVADKLAETEVNFSNITEISHQQNDQPMANLTRTKRTTKKMTSYGCGTMSVVGTVGVGAAGGAAAGAVGGAVAGSVVPVIGTAIGAALGGTIGFFAGAAGGGAATQKSADLFCAEKLDKLIVHRDFGIIQDDDTRSLMAEIKRTNRIYPIVSSDFDGLVIRNKNQVSAKVYATASSPYETDSFVEIKYIVERNLHDTSELLQLWNEHFDKFLRELQRQIKKDIRTFSEQHLSTWKDDKNFQIRSLLIDLRQNIEIILNNHYIRKLYDRILSLENDLVELKLVVERMQQRADCNKMSSRLDMVPSVTSKFDKVTQFVPKIIEFVPQSASLVPVVGYIFSGLSILNSAICFVDTL